MANTSEKRRFPALFVSHGSPMVAIQSDGWNRSLESWAKSQPKPTAIVAISAHWEADSPIRISSSESPETIHDFGGFPDALYELDYPAPGSPALAREVADLLRDTKSAGTVPAFAPLTQSRGFDHGVWVPLRFLYPDASVPVVCVSLARPRTTSELIEVGRALAPLRERGILLFGSGGVVHNLGILDWENKHAEPLAWARAFDEWFARSLEAPDFTSAIAGYEKAPQARLAVPTTEHFDPVFPVLASAAQGERATTVFAGFHHATLSMRSFAISS